jgi:CRP/FNR family cyclic AMP-dependent transcriptional regulator
MKYDYNIIKNYSLFDGLTEIEIQKFISLMKFETVKDKGIIMKEGDNGDTIVLLLSGEVSITQALTLKNKKSVADNREKILIRLDANLHPFFGEISLFNEVDRRTATITATSECNIAILDDDDIINLCNDDNSVGYKIMKNLAEKLSSNLEKTNNQVLKLTTVFNLILDN